MRSICDARYVVHKFEKSAVYAVQMGGMRYDVRSGSRRRRSGQMTNRNAYRCSANLAAQPIWQSGSLANLAIWRLSQSGKSIISPEWAIWRLSQSGNLVLHPIWCNLAMSPIWPTWYESQSGNLADGPIWHEHTKIIIMISFLRKIPAQKP